MTFCDFMALLTLVLFGAIGLGVLWVVLSIAWEVLKTIHSCIVNLTNVTGTAEDREDDFPDPKGTL